jgi:hypothetical protein
MFQTTSITYYLIVIPEHAIPIFLFPHYYFGGNIHARIPLDSYVDYFISVFFHCVTTSMAGIPVVTCNRDYENTDVQNNVDEIVYLYHYPNTRIHSRHFPHLPIFKLRKFPCCYLLVVSSTTLDESLALPLYMHAGSPVPVLFFFF